jgi:hypothetical protein
MKMTTPHTNPQSSCPACHEIKAMIRAAISFETKLTLKNLMDQEHAAQTTTAVGQTDRKTSRNDGGGNMIFIDRFDTVSHLRGKRRTYENIKAAVIEAGRFSVFEVETDRDGRMFTQLCHDPDLEITLLQYPWTGVKLKAMEAANV